jgi:hypothetical protein
MNTSAMLLSDAQNHAPESNPPGNLRGEDVMAISLARLT